MKLLLISTNSKYIHSSLAVYYLKSAVDFLECEIIETTIKENKEKLLSKILKQNADVIGFSCYIWNITYLKPIFTEIKNLSPKTKILLGGPEVSYNPSEVFEDNPAVDYIISGEGEEPFYSFAKIISRSDSYTDSDFGEIPGFCTRTKINPPFYSEKDPKTPYTDEYFERLNGRIAYIESSRGCPFKCSFCLSGDTGGARFFSLDTLFQSIEKLKVSGCKTIKFIDRTFNANIPRTIKIIKHLLQNYEKNDNICYHFEIAGDILTDEIIGLLRSAPIGLFQVEAGIQSINEQTLINVRRKTNTKKLLSNLSKLIEPKSLHTHIDLIAGLPGEDFESFKSGFNTVYKLKPDMLQLGFLKLLHGSYMENNNSFAKFDDTPPYCVIETDCLSKDEISTLSDVEYAVDKLYNSGRFSSLLELSEDYYSCPFDMFLEFSKSVKPIFKEGLEDFYSRVFNYFATILGRDKTADALKIDWISTNSKGALPPALRSENMGILLREIDKISGHRRKKGVKRGAAALLCTNQIIYVDYIEKNPVTARYKINYIPLTEDILDKISKL